MIQYELMGGKETLQRDCSASRKILAETIPFTLLNGKNGIVKPVNYVTLLSEVSNFLDTGTNNAHIGSTIERGLDFCLINSRYFAGELNEEDLAFTNKLSKKTTNGKNELVELIHRIFAKEPEDTVFNNEELNQNTIFGHTLKHIDSNIKISSKEISREIVNGIAIAKKTCGIADKINRRELFGIFNIASRLLAMSMKFDSCHRFMLEWNKDIQYINDKNLKNLVNAKTMGAMYVLIAAASLDKEQYIALSKLMSYNFGEDGKNEETIFGSAQIMTKVYSK